MNLLLHLCFLKILTLFPPLLERTQRIETGYDNARALSGQQLLEFAAEVRVKWA